MAFWQDSLMLYKILSDPLENESDRHKGPPFPLVRKPSRYSGGEVNSIKKDLSKVSLKFAMGFPDAYEIGMSHLGLQILYQVLNAREDISCERVFAPSLGRGRASSQKGLEALDPRRSSIPLSELDLPAVSLERVLGEVKARYVVGLTATPQRRDGHHPITEMQLGPVRFAVDPKPGGAAPLRSQARGA